MSTCRICFLRSSSRATFCGCTSIICSYLPAYLSNWCWCLHPMKAGAALSLMIRLRVPPAGRMGGIVRCGCNLSLAARMAYLMYVGGRMAKSAPQIAISPSRPATPRALICPFVFLSHSPLSSLCQSDPAIRFLKSPLDFQMRSPCLRAGASFILEPGVVC